MDVLQLADRFDLDDDLLVDDQIEAVSIDRDTAIANADTDLPRKRNSALLELEAKSLFVGILEKSWAKSTVNGDGSTDDPLGKLTMRGIGKAVWTAETPRAQKEFP